jgi:hypothetical protein
VTELPETISSREFMQGNDERPRERERDDLTSCDPEKVRRDERYLIAIADHGPRPSKIAKALGITHQAFDNWLMDASYRHPQIMQDDDGSIYVDATTIDSV